MKIANRAVLLCNCGGTMPLDAGMIGRAAVEAGLTDDETLPTIHRCLCDDEIAAVRRAAAGGTCLVACTQEIARFRRAEVETGVSDMLDFVDIREAAGWSSEAGDATAKIVAILAAATIDAPPNDLVTLTCAGRTLIHGRDQAAVDAAERLSGRLDVRLVLVPGSDVLLPATRRVPIAVGRVRSAVGALGAFAVTFDDYAELVPWARDIADTRALHDGETLGCDLVLDLSGDRPWFPDPGRRLGYVRADTRRPELVERGLLDLTGFVGTVAKPRYVAHEPSLCAHAAGGRIGCTRCLDACPTGAVTSDRVAIAVNAAICAGCGSCAAACPTEAMTYAAPTAPITRRRIAALTGAYCAAGGARPVVLLHSAQRGEEAIAALARSGPGLPANVLPLAVRQPTQLGLDAFATAFALGAVRLVVQIDPEHAEETMAVRDQTDLANHSLAALGWGDGRAVAIASAEQDALLAAVREASPLPDIPELPMLDVEARRHDLIRLVFEHLAAAAPRRPDVVTLPTGAPFGRVQVGDACTVCLACTRSCPTGALVGQSTPPVLSFEEARCVQCGLCEAVCPEGAIEVEPRLLLGDAAALPRILRSDEPMVCTSCGTRFGSRAATGRVVAKLEASDWAHQNLQLVARLRLCERCRVTDQ